MAKLRIAIIDDHGIVRMGLRNAIVGEPDLEVVGEAATAEDAVAMLERTRPDVVLLDHYLPDHDGIDIANALQSASPASRLLVVSSDDAQASRCATLAALVAGFVSKECPVHDLVWAIRNVAVGRWVMNVPAPSTFRPSARVH